MMSVPLIPIDVLFNYISVGNLRRIRMQRRTNATSIPLILTVEIIDSLDQAMSILSLTYAHIPICLVNPCKICLCRC